MKNTANPQRSVHVIPYQPGWPAAFAEEQAALLAVLADVAIALHHIGSTAVPGLAAKPIIDLLLEVTDFSQLDARSAALTALGYVAKGEHGISGRRYFQKGGNKRSHHLHVFLPGAPQISQHLRFRDYLRANAAAAADYAALKLSLASQFPQDPARYQAGKDAWIQQLLQQACAHTDDSRGYQAKASEFRFWREQSQIGVATVLQWAQQLTPGCAILDLGCGSGIPLAKALSERGFTLFGIDAAPALVAAYQQLLPQATVLCAAVEHAPFFQRRFDAVLMVGLIFLLPAATQRQLFPKVAAALAPQGRWLFSAPAQPCQWQDLLTGQTSLSLGADTYRQLLSQAGLQLQAQYQDEGGNHYFAASLR